MNPKLIYTIVVAVGGALEEGARNLLRSNGQKKLQLRVDKSAPQSSKKDLTVSNDQVQITLLKDECLDLKNCQEMPMTEKEINEWKSLISVLGGETTKNIMTAKAFDGLLKCDVPLKDLCRAKDNSGAMRGMVFSDGKISKQASFSEVGFEKAAPLMIYQCMAAVTSQYYQHIITERLNTIDTKLENIIRVLAADDQAKLKVAYKHFVELRTKTTYDIADKQIVSDFSTKVEIILEKYRDLLRGIKHLNVKYQWSDKKEAELKIKSLYDSKYFDYLDMAMQAEVLNFIASTISLKVAMSLGNDEDAKIYAARLNIDYWNNYVDQFYQIKHDVIKYLELEADASWIQGKSINALKDEQLKKFNSVEASMLKLQKQFECKTVQYLRCQEDGTLKKYISVSKS